MARVIRNTHANIAIEIMCMASQAVVVHRMSGAPELETFRFLIPDHRRDYETEWREALDKGGVPLEAAYTARRFLRGDLRVPELNSPVILALAGILPVGDNHLVSFEDGVIGHFAQQDDAVLISKALRTPCTVVGSAAEVKALPREQLERLCAMLGVTIPKKLTKPFFTGVVEMAKKAEAKKATKIVKAEGSKRRADGPIAKIAELVGKHDITTREGGSELLAAALKVGINKSTASTQLAAHRKKQGIVLRRTNGEVKANKPKTSKPKVSTAQSAFV